jgi:hypothetical protein
MNKTGTMDNAQNISRQYLYQLNGKGMAETQTCALFDVTESIYDKNFSVFSVIF